MIAQIALWLKAERKLFYQYIRSGDLVWLGLPEKFCLKSSKMVHSLWGHFRKLLSPVPAKQLGLLHGVLKVKRNLKTVKSIREIGIHIDGSGSIMSRFVLCQIGQFMSVFFV